MTLDINAIGREVFARFINNGFTATGSPVFTAATTFIINGNSVSIRILGTTRLNMFSGATGSTSSITIDTNALLCVRQSTTALAPAAVLGAQYFDTTLNKLRIGGAGPAWETVTSAA